MILDKHKLDGITQITAKTLPSTEIALKKRRAITRKIETN
jgi:hypothetical protein